MKKIADGRWPVWLRSFRYRLVFFSSLTITAIIIVFGIAVFSLFTFMEIDSVDNALVSSSAEITGFFETAGRLPAFFWQDRVRTAVFQIYDEDMSLLFHLPPGVAAPTVDPSLLRLSEDSKDQATFIPGQKRFLPRLWWILPWNYLEDQDLWRISVTATTMYESKAFLVAMTPLAPLLQSRRLLFWMIVLTSAAGVLLSLLVGEMVAGQAIKPLKLINRAISRVSIENMDIESPPGETDREILEIVQHIRNMLQGLKQSVTNLQQFTSDASHELRTPLAIMRGTVDVALLRGRDSEYYVRKLQDLIYNIEDMQNLVGALLELSRLDNMQGLPSREPADLLMVAEDAISNASSLISKRGQVLKEKLEPAPTSGREVLILRLVNNLLENASKHSPPGSSIGINTYINSDSGESVIEIWDQGPGLGPEEISRCFDRFWRAEYSRTTPGFGLGLPLVQRIAQIHGAKIDIESQKGKGSLFRVRFLLDREALKDYDFE